MRQGKIFALEVAFWALIGIAVLGCSKPVSSSDASAVFAGGGKVNAESYGGDIRKRQEAELRKFLSHAQARFLYAVNILLSGETSALGASFSCRYGIPASVCGGLASLTSDQQAFAIRVATDMAGLRQLAQRTNDDLIVITDDTQAVAGETVYAWAERKDQGRMYFNFDYWYKRLSERTTFADDLAIVRAVFHENLHAFLSSLLGQYALDLAKYPPFSDDTGGAQLINTIAALLIDFDLGRNESLVVSLFSDLLGRGPQPSDTSFYAGLLRSPSGDSAARRIYVSGEASAFRVLALYMSLLRRGGDGDPAGVAYYQSLDKIGQWTKMAGSNEYYQRIGGGSDRGFLRSLYADLLGRGISEDELATQIGRLGGMSRESLVHDLVVSPEFRSHWIGSVYLTILGRPPRDAERTARLTALAAGTSYEDIEIALYESDDYRYHRLFEAP